jgi:hypothetical protein
MNDDFRPVAYIKEGCPFSMKFLEFVEEADLIDRIDVVRVAAGTPEMEAVKEKLSNATDERAQFPTVEIAPGEFKTESDELIEYFAEKYERSTR